MAAMTRPPETSTMGREISKKLRMAEPMSWMTAKKMRVLMAMRRARVR
jgi:hypothetical protein